MLVFILCIFIKIYKCAGTSTTMTSVKVSAMLETAIYSNAQQWAITSGTIFYATRIIYVERKKKNIYNTKNKKHERERERTKIEDDEIHLFSNSLCLLCRAFSVQFLSTWMRSIHSILFNCFLFVTVLYVYYWNLNGNGVVCVWVPCRNPWYFMMCMPWQYETYYHTA